MDHKKILSLLSLLLLGQTICKAQDSLTIQLKEHTVVATRTEKHILETGRSVTVLDENDLQNSGAQTLGEILEKINGLYITGTGQTAGSNQSLFLRGSNSNQTAIFIDGIRISDVSTVNGTLDLSELPLNDVERIEVIRGAHSGLYGSGAVGGVIQIQTKKPQHTGITARASVLGGVFGKETSLINPALYVAAKSQKGWYGSVFADHTLVKGLDATLDTISTPDVFKNLDRDDWKKTQTNFQFGKKSEKINAHLYFRSVKMKTDIDRAAFTDDDNYILDYNRETFGLSSALQLNSKHSIQLNAGYTRTERAAVNDSSIIDGSGNYDRQYTSDRYIGKSLQADLLSIHTYQNWTGSIGTSIVKEEMEQENYIYSALFDPFIYESRTNLSNPRPEATSLSIFGQADLRGSSLSKKTADWNLLTGFRFTNHSLAGNQFMLELNPSYKVSNQALLYFSYNNGFNSPSLYQQYASETYLPFDGSPGSGISRGNKNLKSERSASYEFGIKQKLNSVTFFGLSIYKSVTENLIEYVYLWDKNISIHDLATDFNRDDYRGDRYLNVGKQEVTGMELTLQTALSDRLLLNAGMNLLYGHLDFMINEDISSQASGNHIQLYSNGAFLDQSRRFDGLARRPGSARAELIWKTKKWLQLSGNVVYIGTRSDVFYDNSIPPYGALANSPVQAYALVNLSGMVNLKNKLSLICRLENLTDESYSEINGFSTRGRSFFMKIAYSI